jgi:hypothetical protein
VEGAAGAQPTTTAAPSPRAAITPISCTDSPAARSVAAQAAASAARHHHHHADAVVEGAVHLVVVDAGHLSCSQANSSVRGQLPLLQLRGQCRPAARAGCSPAGRRR